MVAMKLRFHVIFTFFWWFSTWIIYPVISQSTKTDLKTCLGTDSGLSKISIAGEPRLLRMKQLYTKCVIMHGNLELVGITKMDLNEINDTKLSFLDDLEEVTGYVLIADNLIPTLNIPKLRIIWGDNTYTMTMQKAVNGSNYTRFYNNFSLVIKGNSMKDVIMPSLRAVQNSIVAVLHNKYMCHWRSTIDFRQLLGDDWQNRYFQYENFNSCTEEDYQCSGCDFCFGNDPSLCQQIYRNDCAMQCSTPRMCFNKTSPMFCCKAECAAGCFGPSAKDCYGCNNFRSDGMCVDTCPSREVYNPTTRQYEINPNGKFAYNRDCVDQCPPEMRIYKDGCVSKCPEGYFEDKKKICQFCIGSCPKTCEIKDEVITSRNIEKFINCTIVEGSIVIRSETFHGIKHFPEPHDLNQTSYFIKGISPDDLEYLSNVQEVTDALAVMSPLPLKSLFFLRKLRVVEGRSIPRFMMGTSIVIHGTNLEELGLLSLRYVTNGKVQITRNNRLCYIDDLPWNSTISPTRGYAGQNADKLNCKNEGKVCHESCDPSTGCWGAGADMCFECRHYKLDQTCVLSCRSEDGFYETSPKNCDHCHDECLSCDGPSARNCTQCRNVLLNDECVSECPNQTHFLNETSRTCVKCHDDCFRFGCSGTGRFIGQGGCNKCKFAVVDENESITTCLSVISPEHLCSKTLGLENYFWASPNNPRISPYVSDGVCQKCHKWCRKCSGYGTDEENNGCLCDSSVMRVYKQDTGSFYCATKCPNDHYTIARKGNGPQECHPCHAECDECYGPSANECNKCKNHKVIGDDEKSFNCTSKCPENKPYSLLSDKICSEVDKERLKENETRQRYTIIAGVGVLVVLLMIAACIGAFWFRRRSQLLLKLPYPDDETEINPDAKPDLSQLRVMAFESELKFSEKPLGIGAFGVVYKGVWIDPVKKVKVPVAIKVLHEATPAAQQEMLEEASLMARTNHAHLIKLIGVCMSSERMMLVTPLMPLGNLLEYVQNNRNKIGSSALLRWCQQIAAGMSHLENHRLVHRDLAARNILVQNPYRVRITDFGLAKMLDYGEEELKVYEGKMPIKWLALECIQHKRFTHKSDVWAYGVTVWELLTFGDKPYKDTPLKQIICLLEKGERLQQPKICTLDVYMILIKCWMVDADSRPSFNELHDNFMKMLKDPGRYLVIEGDKFMRLPSVTTAEQCKMAQDLVGDQSVCYPDEYLDQVDSSSIPSTPTKPLLDHQQPEIRSRTNHRNQSTSSHRYASDPLKNKNAPVDISIPKTDPSNYLEPNSISKGKQVSISPLNNGNYTPVVTSNVVVPGSKMAYYNLPSPSEDSAIFSGNDSAADNLEYMLPRSKVRSHTPSGVEVVQTETVV